MLSSAPSQPNPPELDRALARIAELRAAEERIGILLAQWHARVAALLGDREGVREWAAIDRLAHRRGECCICGRPTGRSGSYRRVTCSAACLDAVRHRRST